MRTKLVIILILLLAVVVTVWRPWSTSTEEKFAEYEEEDRGEKPHDWFYMQRAYPQRLINEEVHKTAYRQALFMAQEYAARSEGVWIPKGPTNIGGRITGIALDPTNGNVIYAGAADGGVLKSTDGGVNWTMLTDHFITLSVGDVTIDPSNPNTVYVGLGEANLAGDNYDGDGVYRTTDGGATWTNIGLAQTRRIGRVAVHPSNSDIIFVAGAGAQFSADSARGVYRTTDGGVTWEKVLYVSDTTSAIDLRINPSHPDTVYAAMWERLRSPTRRKAGGITSGIYRSTDMGTTWSELTNGLPSGVNVGRIGIAICPSVPNILYAIYADSIGYFEAVFKTTDGGNSWGQTSGQPSSYLYSSFGWYFGQIRVHPENPDIVFVLGVPLYRTTNGGSSWSDVSGIQHVDHHALEFDMTNMNHIVDGNDGGVYYSNNGGSVWTKSYNLPITQFYAATIDELNPQRTYGGTQDNGTLRTMTGNLNDWEMIYGGDGFYCIVDYTNANIIYAEYQWGNLAKSTNGGNNFTPATNGINPGDRTNWSTPVIMDPNNHLVLYYGANRLYKTTDGAGFWNAISGELTNGPGSGNLTYGTITTIAVSKTDSDVIYLGTDDANVWVTTNGGTEWMSINSGLPDRWVTRVVVDPTDGAIAYVTFSGYRYDSYQPHVFRTTNYGANWTDISSNLPEVPINVIVIDPQNTSVLYIGTDYGVYYTIDVGSTWQPLGTGLPFSAVDDLVLHNGTRILRAATHGRSFFEFDLNQIAIKEDETFVRLNTKGIDLQVMSPSRNAIRLLYSVGEPGVVRISIYDAAGRHVQRLLNEKVNAGTRALIKTVNLPSGNYFIRMEARGENISRKIEIVR
ncbi:MAG: T9SS type A sorting domain-containing protein [candidate division WOR-3 bacterium]|nr:MAG: T9SS type A sorting domain-containing protein [candidate division WOR-3 bacterium]